MNWYPLSWCDPTSGDPVVVRDAGLEYQRVAAQIEAAADDLRAISGGFTQCSDAIDEVQAKAARLADTIERAHGRYAATGAALVGYADGLARAQQLSLTALTVAQTAAQAQSTAQDDVYYWSRRADQASDPFEVARHTGRVDAARRDLIGADRRLEAAQVQLHHAVTIRDDAAETARAAIHAVVKADDLHDTIWQDLGGGIQEIGSWAWDHLDEAATWAGVVALALCWMPGVNAALASVATMLAVATFARDGVDLMRGKGSWTEFGLSALGVVSFGVGRLATKGLRMAANSTRAAQGRRTATAVEESVDAATTTARAATSAASGAERAMTATVGRPAVRGILRSGELWNTLKPSVVWTDTVRNLGGVRILRAPGLYASQAPGLHVSRPLTEVSNPYRETRAALSNTWQQDRVATLFQALGNEGAASDAVFLAQHGGPGKWWLWTTGATQAVETGRLAYDFAHLGAK